MTVFSYFQFFNYILMFVVASTLSQNHTIFVRIVTNFEDVVNGVPVDFRYNESSTESEGLSSVPGCPKSEQGVPWIYYGSPTKCFLSGERGPCDSDQKLFFELESPNGVCNCDCFEDVYDGSGFDFNTMKFCTKNSREMVFDPKMKMCFTIYDQGPCESKDWLVKVQEENLTDSDVRCEPRKCPKGQIPFALDGERKEFNSTANCFSPISAFFGPVSITPNDCDTGAKYSELLKRCIKKAKTSGSIIG